MKQKLARKVVISLKLIWQYIGLSSSYLQNLEQYNAGSHELQPFKGFDVGKSSKAGKSHKFEPVFLRFGMYNGKSILKVTIRRPLIHPNFFPEFSPFQQDAVGVYVLYYARDIWRVKNDR